MKLYLMRHAEPIPGDREDASRGLTPEGQRQAREMGAFLQRQIGTVQIIITSPFTRAAETAQIVGKVLGCGHIEATRLLRPETVSTADMYGEISRIAQQAEHVLVVGHHPSLNDLITWLCGAQTFERHFKHGSIAHVDGDNLVWLVTPKMIEKDAGEQDVIESAGRLVHSIAIDLSEHLMRNDRKAVIDPLVNKLKSAVARRFRRQGAAAASLAHANNPTVAVKHSFDPKFRTVYSSVTAKAYAAGSEHALGMLPYQGLSYNEAEKPRDLPGPKRTAQTIEDELDSTSIERLAAVLNAARTTDQTPISYADLAAQVKALFQQWAQGGDGELSRAEMTAINEVSLAYHQGMADLAKQWAGGNGPVEKKWIAQPDACDECAPNADEGWIDSEAPFGSGDFEPPVHPNCRCSIEYQPTEVTEPA